MGSMLGSSVPTPGIRDDDRCMHKETVLRGVRGPGQGVTDRQA